MKIRAVNYGLGESRDLILHFTTHRQFSFRWYSQEQGSNWGIRKLGSGYQRFALDFGRLSFVFENYNY